MIIEYNVITGTRIFTDVPKMKERKDTPGMLRNILMYMRKKYNRYDIY